jgi:hypothetical protein
MNGPGRFEVPATGLRTVEAIAFGWCQFRRFPGEWIALALITGALTVAALVPVLLFTTDGQSDELHDRDLLALVGNTVASIAAGITSAAVVKGALLQMSGGRPGLKASLSVMREPQIWLLSAMVAVASAAADYVAFGLSFVVFFLTVYAWIYVIDAGQDAWTAIRSGLDLVGRNLARNLVLFIGSGFVVFGGFLACVVGLLVSIPVVTLAYVYAYRVLANPDR